MKLHDFNNRFSLKDRRSDYPVNDEKYTNSDVMLQKDEQTLMAIRDFGRRMSDLELNIHNIQRGFSKNDIGEHDFDTHRRDHLKISEQSKIMDKYKKTIAESILVWVLRGVMLAAGAVILDYIKNHMV
jgi:hypothetical protein